MRIPRPVHVARLSILVGLGLGLAVATTSAAQPSPRPPAPTTTHHFVTNLHGAVSGPRSVGFNVFDTGDSPGQVRDLPPGVKALVWLGQKCPQPADAEFRTSVRRLAKSPKVFGYYLSDEPHIADCPGGPKALATRTAYIRKLSGGRQQSFIVLSEDEDYRPFSPARSGVTMVGVDPYPCSRAHPGCKISKIDEDVRTARANGISLSRIVPVYQAFGQGRTTEEDRYYRLPHAAQMRAMIARWARLVPHPPMDYAYGWGNQGSANPTLTDSAALRGVFRAYFAR